MNKTNIAEILKNCPSGMELNCLIYDNVYFKCVREHAIYPIVCYTIDSKGKKEEITFNWYGKHTPIDTAKCVIFPKGKTTWEGFVTPCKFKDGDVLYIATGEGEYNLRMVDCIIGDILYTKASCSCNGHFLCTCKEQVNIEELVVMRFATEEEKEKLFKAIKDNGYKWNAETKTLEKLVEPQFEDGDILATDLGSVFYLNTRLNTDECYGCYVGISGDGSFHLCEPFAYKECCGVATEEEKQKLLKAIKDRGYKWNEGTKALEKLNIPKFHEGDWITNGEYTWKVISVDYLDYTLQNQLGEYVDDTINYVNKVFHLWTINDAKDGDVLACNEEILLFKSYLAPGYVSLYCWYNGQTDNFHSREVTNALLTTINKICPVTKKQHDLFFTKIKETGYEWVVETKTLVRLIQPKFKVGDKVIHKNNHNVIFTITNIENDYYICRAKKVAFGFHDQDNYELVNEPKFKVGDIITDNRGNICIYKGPMSYNKNLIGFYCGYRITDNAFIFKHLENKHFGDVNEYRFASEEEKAKMFRIIKQNGYKWNSETKILEKLIIQKFKVGNRIKYKNGIEQGVILSITDNTYYDVAVTNNIGISVRIIDQDEWELIPNKFDINTLIPFESKVLVRHDKDNKWTGSFFSFIDRDLNSHCYKFVTTADKSYPMMIPYKGNEYLLGKVEDCKDFYKIWE